jgi:protein TonB
MGAPMIAPTAYERIRGAVPVALVHAVLVYGILSGLAVAFTPEAKRETKVLNLAPPPPLPVPEIPMPPPVPDTGETESEVRADPREEGAASPPNIESRRTQIVAPTQERASPVRAATEAGTGSDTTQGAAPVEGPGTGSGGIGTGTGSGDGGDGSGAGGGGGRGEGRLRRPRRIAGRLSDRDYPPGLGEAGVQGPVWVRFAVETDGSVSNCTVTESSGSALLDRHTCDLIEARYRYRPARDGSGRPIRSSLIEYYEWVVQDLPEEHEEPRRRRRMF